MLDIIKLKPHNIPGQACLKEKSILWLLKQADSTIQINNSQSL